MGQIDSEASARLQAELMSGESFLWTGRPNSSVLFHSGDWYMIPFSLLWGGFAIFWEAGVLGYWGQSSKGTPSVFMALWGIPFIVAGQYIIWGRFVYDAWLKRRTYYGVTNRRILVLQEGWTLKTSSAYIDAIPSISREGGVTGTLWFGPKYPVIAARGQRTSSISTFAVGDVPVFVDVDDADSLYKTVMDLREQLTRARSSGPS